MPDPKRLYTRSSGPEGAPSILFLHGGGGAGWMWDPVVARLESAYHCLVPDLPEHGASREVGAFSMPFAAEKAAEIIREQAHGGKAHVVGLSEGAQVTVQLLSDAPELVDHAVISSALLEPIPGTGWMSSRGVLRWTYRLAIPPFRNADWWIRLNMKYAAGIPRQYYPQFKADFQATTESQFTNLMHANQLFRLPAGISAAAGVPALVVVGSKEYAAMKQSARELATALPGAKAVQVNLGRQATLAMEHNWALTAPDLFAQTVRAWLESLPLPQELAELQP